MKLTQLKQILQNWDLGEIKDIKKAEKGFVNHNWIVKTDKEKYVLRNPHQEYTNKDINFELSCLSYFKRKDFRYKIPSPVSTKNGKNIVKKGKNFFWVYEFIEGEFNDGSSKRELSEIALMLSTYHKFLEKAKIKINRHGEGDYGKENMLKSIEGDIKKSLKSKAKKEKIFSREAKKLIPILESLDGNIYDSFKKYSIHRDLNPENFLWKKKKIIGIIDFDNLSYTSDPLIKDIAVTMQYSCSKNKRKLNIRKARYFLREYQKHRRLLKKEIEIIPEIIVATFIEDFSYVYWMLIHDPERAKLGNLKSYSKAAQWYWKNKEKIVWSLK